MGGRSRAGRAELHLGLVCLGVGDELLEVLHRQVLARDERDRHLGDQPDGGEIGLRVVQRLLVERLGLGVGADGADDEVVAVGRAVGDTLGAGLAAGAGDVLDHHLLAESFAHLRADHAAEHVGRTAGGERDHHGDRAGRIILRGGAGGEPDKAGQHAGDDFEHEHFLRLLPDTCPARSQRSSRDLSRRTPVIRRKRRSP